MKQEAIVQLIDIALAALGVLPEIVRQVQSLFELRAKVIRGEEVTPDDLNAIMAELRGRSKLIQAS